MVPLRGLQQVPTSPTCRPHRPADLTDLPSAPLTGRACDRTRLGHEAVSACHALCLRRRVVKKARGAVDADVVALERAPRHSSRSHPHRTIQDTLPDPIPGSSGLRSSRPPSTSAPARIPSPQLDAPVAFGHAPAGHSAHVSGDDAPRAAEHVPAGHDSHVVDDDASPDACRGCG